MEKHFFMGIDIGTYSTKGVITDEIGNIILSKIIEHNIITPKAGYVEHDPEQTWWYEFCKISKWLLKNSNIKPNSLKAVGVSGIGPCCLPVNHKCEPLRNAILYGIDTRSVEEIQYINNKLGKSKIFELCGQSLDVQAVGPKILWIKNNEPNIYKDTAKFLTSTSYIVAKLTGNYVIDHYTACTFAPLYNYKKQAWDYSLCNDIVNPNQLPEIKWTTDIAGTINKQAEIETGIQSGTSVIVGSVDAAAEAMSVGVTEPKEMMLMYGSTHFMIGITDAPIKDSRVWTGPYLFPGTYAVMGGLATSGALTVWYKENFAVDYINEENAGDENVFTRLSKEVIHIPIGSNGIMALPYFSGARTPINNPYAKGVIFGLNIVHKRIEIYRALLEGVGYAIAQNVDTFTTLGLDIQRVYAVGGGTKNEVWMQIISDCCNKEQWVLKCSIGASYGDAFLAALGVGEVKNRNEIKKWNPMRKTIQPIKEHVQKYKKEKEKYFELYNATKNLMNKENI